MANKEELTAQAEEIGIEVEESWTKAQIEEAIDAALATEGDSDEQSEESDGETIKNVSNVRFKIYGKVVQPGGTYKPTEADLADEKGTKRIENAIRKGYLERV